MFINCRLINCIDTENVFKPWHGLPGGNVGGASSSFKKILLCRLANLAEPSASYLEIKHRDDSL